MAYYIEDKEIVDSLDINHVITYFKSKGEDCVRILYGRSFSRVINGEYTLTDGLIIEPLDNKSSYTYQEGNRTFSIDRNRGVICINPAFNKSEIFDTEHSLSKELYQHCLDYKQVLRDNKINEIL
jgi:hypothetical protein